MSAAMSPIDGEKWALTIEVPDETPDFEYNYIVKSDNSPWRYEWGKPHKFIHGKNIKKHTLIDRWQDTPHDKPYYSSAFVDGMLRRKNQDKPLSSIKPGHVRIRVAAPMIEPDEVLAIAGSIPALGNWEPTKALILNDAHFPYWEIDIPSTKLSTQFEYKFLTLKKGALDVCGWEITDNKVFNHQLPKGDQHLSIDGLRYANPHNNWKCAGTAIPVFSIRTDDDFGVGDFIDIKKMVDWCKLTGQKVLQLLPVNDTTLTNTWIDSYPYKANSTFALHPMYLRIENVGTIKNAELKKKYETLRKELNKLPEIDYERVNKAKIEYLREIYAQKKESLKKDKQFQIFIKENNKWLLPYAVWCTLRDKYSTADNSLWKDYSIYDQAKVNKFASAHHDEIEFYQFLQYHLDLQLGEARDYARNNEVILKGDIPIGISRHSVDAWMYPQLFNMNSQAGAPPDDFSVLGQNWGFPTYNWEEMSRDGFAWWKARFRKMAQYFDAYRIDHILGFFRIWQIPLDAIHGLLGIFNPALPFSPQEMIDYYDFYIDTTVHTQPLILDWMLHDFFGEYVELVKREYLDEAGYGRYQLKTFVNTQVKVTEHFSKLPSNDANTRICNALLGLIDDVLFIEDPIQKGHYHPRISAQFTYQYRMLSDYAKYCFDRLYNDFFYHRHNFFWGDKAMWKLPPLLDSTDMLTCAEDLGMIPDCVPHVMNSLQILSLEIQRMPKDPKVEFGETWHYPYHSVCTTSTHDMSGIRSWWESDHDMAQRFYNNVLGQYGEAPYYAEPWICDKILDLQLYSPSMLCILPLQDWLSADGNLRRRDPREEQINVPANPKHYWRYRMHIKVEELLEKETFNRVLRSKIHQSNR
jgi:4-alpha-glucanotransferase